jgi:hypothetical protein
MKRLMRAVDRSNFAPEVETPPDKKADILINIRVLDDDSP